MHDMNFFSILKRQKSKNNNLKIIGAIILLFMLLLNGVLFGVNYMATSKLENRIKQNQAFIDSADTKAKMREAEILKSEVSLANEYLTIIKSVANSYQEQNKITVSLMDHIRNMAPSTTFFSSTDFKGNNITLNCLSTNTGDPMSYFHQLQTDTMFSSVRMPGFNIDFNGVVTYSIILTLKDGGTK